jgi:hypothetical protein
MKTDLLPLRMNFELALPLRRNFELVLLRRRNYQLARSFCEADAKHACDAGGDATDEHVMLVVPVAKLKVRLSENGLATTKLLLAHLVEDQ